MCKNDLSIWKYLFVVIKLEFFKLAVNCFLYGYLVTDFSTFLNLIIGIIRTTHFTVKIKIKINKKIKKPFSFKYRTETGCNELTFGDCNLDVGGVLETIYNLSVGKICTYFMLYLVCPKYSNFQYPGNR